MKTYSTDLRCKLAQTYERHLGSQRTLADAFGVSHSFVKKGLRRYRMPGQVVPKPHTRGPKPRLNAAAHAMLRDLARAQPDSTLEELCARLAAATGIQVSVPTMCRMRQRLGFPQKQSRSTAVNGIRRVSNRCTQPIKR
jgi:transposase